MKELTGKIYGERNTIAKLKLRKERAQVFYGYMTGLYNGLYEESLRRGLPKEWCSHPLRMMATDFENNLKRALASAERNYGPSAPNARPSHVMPCTGFPVGPGPPLGNAMLAPPASPITLVIIAAATAKIRLAVGHLGGINRAGRHSSYSINTRVFVGRAVLSSGAPFWNTPSAPNAAGCPFGLTACKVRVPPHRNPSAIAK